MATPKAAAAKTPDVQSIFLQMSDEELEAMYQARAKARREKLEAELQPKKEKYLKDKAALASLLGEIRQIDPAFDFVPEPESPLAIAARIKKALTEKGQSLEQVAQSAETTVENVSTYFSKQLALGEKAKVVKNADGTYSKKKVIVDALS
jgi:hypothetical protein